MLKYIKYVIFPQYNEPLINVNLHKRERFDWLLKKREEIYLRKEYLEEINYFPRNIYPLTVKYLCM